VASSEFTEAWKLVESQAWLRPWIPPYQCQLTRPVLCSQAIAGMGRSEVGITTAVLMTKERTQGKSFLLPESFSVCLSCLAAHAPSAACLH
jgi:hypothetical protein